MNDPARVADALEGLLDVIEAWAEPWTGRPSDPSAPREPIEREAEAEPEAPRGAAPAASPTSSAAPRLHAPPIHFRGMLGSRTRARGEPELDPITAGPPETMLAPARPRSMPARASAHRRPSSAPSTTTVPAASRARDEPFEPMQAPTATRASTSAERHTGFERENDPLAIPFASAPLDPELAEHGAFGARIAFESPATAARLARTAAPIEPDVIEDFAQARSDRDGSSPRHEDLEERLADVLERAALESGIEIP